MALGALKASQHRETVYRFGDASRRAPDFFRFAVCEVVGFVAPRDNVRWVTVNARGEFSPLASATIVATVRSHCLKRRRTRGPVGRHVVNASWSPLAVASWQGQSDGAA